MGTLFSTIYDRFLREITDDMYLELTPQDTIRDLRRMLVNGLPKFEFPRFPIYDYEIQYDVIDADKIAEDDFVIGTVWNELEDYDPEIPPKLIVEKSYFATDLTSEEIDILASIMMEGWLQTQITSIENIRMKYSGQIILPSLLEIIK